MTDYQLVIDGKLVDGAGTIDVINPATEAVVARCPVASEAQLDAAVAAAKAAFPAWAATPLSERAAHISRIADRVEAEIETFARLLTAEQGKPLDQARFEMLGAIYTLRAFAGMEIERRVLREDDRGTVIELRKPLGVVAAITPWNFPVALLINKVAPALLAGNTLVCKPAATTPLTTLKFGEICRDLLPAGVVNVICDQNDLGARLCAHPDVAKIAFTGSTATGKKVMATAAGTVKRVTLELGGNDAAIVLDDMDPADAARRVFDGAMLNAGQICVAVKRAYVPTSLYDRFCDELVRLADAAIVDDGSKQGAQIGPVQNRMQFDKLNAFLEKAAGQGKIIAGGKPLDRPGYFIPPTIVRDLPDDAELVQEEQFGPVLPVLAYDDIDDAVTRANDSQFGLAGTVWGKDFERALDVAQRIDSGTIWVNQHLAIDPSLPFRGAKQSGLGAELGEAGLLEYTQASIVNGVPLDA